jgi:hypothetical protein
MKKLLFLFSFCACFLMASAQKSTTTDLNLGYDQTWYTYTSTANATTATDSTWYWTTIKESVIPVKYDIKISLDSVSGTKQVTPVVLKAKKFISDSWTTITTINWTNGHDTTVLFNQNSTAQYYRYWQVYIKSNRKAFIFKVTELSQKFWE